MNDPKPSPLIKILIAIVVINALATAWLAKTVLDQDRRLQTLERHDKVQQTVDNLNSKYESLKSRVEGLFK